MPQPLQAILAIASISLVLGGCASTKESVLPVSQARRMLFEQELDRQRSVGQAPRRVEPRSELVADVLSGEGLAGEARDLEQGAQAGPPRAYAFASRDRVDEVILCSRTVIDGQYQYIRNFLPHLPWYHEMTRDYPRLQPTYQIWHQLAREEKLSGPNAIYMAHQKPREQLFDLAFQ